MKWFGRKAAGRDLSRPALARSASGVPLIGEWPRGYEAQVREGYAGNPVAQRAVRLVVEGVGAAPLVASEPGIEALVRARSGGQQLVETVAAQLLLHGNAYVQILCGCDGGAAELYALRPERVAIEGDASGWPVAYRYRVVQAFDDVAFPLALGREAEVSPGWSTAIVASAGGHEKRNAEWAEARTRYDVGPGVRSEADIAELLSFFRARMGSARGFRLRDPFDGSSGGGVPSATDQVIGVGDGHHAVFPLVKHYGEQARRITRPVAGSVRVAIDGVETHGFAIEARGEVVLDDAPGEGALVTAGYLFDVPVRFAEDRLTVNRATYRAGAAPSVPLIELREA